MTYQVLARKWRPKLFGEVIGQEHVTRTLQNSVKRNEVAHAYLLTGTRGVGKTTIARIFAKAIRCENLQENGDPCLKCSSCTSIDDGSSLDYQEIDGASNTGVDNIRELIDNAQYLPTQGSKKVYVIDEVHMLTVNAFNALLKTLEEPPKHVIFIFATTDPQKLLGTVLSRCQRFDFKNVQIEQLVSHIKNISEKENISFESDRLIYQLAKQGNGSVRDTLSLLDQVLSLTTDRNITEESMLLSLGLAKTTAVKNILNSIIGCDKELCSKSFQEALDENVDLSKFSLQLLDNLFSVIENIDRNGDVSESIVDSNILEQISISELLWIYETLSKDLQWALSSLNPEQMVLFCINKLSLRDTVFQPETKKINIKKKEMKPEQHQFQEQVDEDIVEQKVVIQSHTESDKTWTGFISYLKSKNQSIAANLERGNVLVEPNTFDDEVKIEVGFAEDNKIFLDFLKENQGKEKIKEHVADFYSVNKERIKIEFSSVSDQMKEKSNFMSKVEIEEEHENKIEEEKKDKILNNKYIKEAEKIFNSKINKVILSKK